MSAREQIVPDRQRPEEPASYTVCNCEKQIPRATRTRRRRRRKVFATSCRSYSNGSSLIREEPWLLPTQKVAGFVELSTSTRRMLVDRGSRYSVNSPV